MIVIDVVEMTCEVVETNEHGIEKVFKGTISEIHYDTNNLPYRVLINWNNKTRLIQPRFEDDAMRIKQRNGRGTIDIFVPNNHDNR